MSFLLTICTVFLILTSLFVVLIVLMQRANANSGMGTALGGNISESTFGAETGNVLTRWTVYAAIIFFILSFLLYLGYMHQNSKGISLEENLPSIKELQNSAESSAPLTLPSDLTTTSEIEETLENSIETKTSEATEQTPTKAETVENSESIPMGEATEPIETEKMVEPVKP